MIIIWDKSAGSALGYYENRETADAVLASLLAREPHREPYLYMQVPRDEEEYLIASRNFEDGTWDAPVWANTSFYREGFHRDQTFVHISEEDPAYVSFFASPKALKAGRKTTTKPGRYLLQFHGDELSSSHIERWANIHREQWVQDGTFAWAKTPEQIANVYQMEASFQSCMQYGYHPTDGWSKAGFDEDLLVHPTYIYGAGDLELAYVHRGDRLVARALVWREKGRVGRVYGDAPLLRGFLKREGINTVSSNANYDSLEGARVLKIPFEPKDRSDYTGYEDQELIISPYIDGYNIYGVQDPANPNYLTLIHNDSLVPTLAKQRVYQLQTTGGVGHSSTCCVNCGTHTFNAVTVQTKDKTTGEPKAEKWGTNCCGSVMQYSEVSHRYFDGEYYQRVQAPWHSSLWGSGRRYAAKGLDDIVYSDYTKEWYKREDTIEVEEIGALPWWLVGDYSFVSDVDGKRYPLHRKTHVIVDTSTIMCTKDQSSDIISGEITLDNLFVTKGALFNLASIKHVA